MKYNEQIKQGRKALGMTQKELSEKVGVITRQIQFIEAGKSFPNYKTLVRICEVLGIYIVFPEKV